MRPQQPAHHPLCQVRQGSGHARRPIQVDLYAMGPLAQADDEGDGSLADGVQRIGVQNGFGRLRMLAAEVVDAEIDVGVNAPQTGLDGRGVGEIDLVNDQFAIAQPDHFPAQAVQRFDGKLPGQGPGQQGAGRRHAPGIAGDDTGRFGVGGPPRRLGVRGGKAREVVDDAVRFQGVVIVGKALVLQPTAFPAIGPFLQLALEAPHDALHEAVIGIEVGLAQKHQQPLDALVPRAVRLDEFQPVQFVGQHLVVGLGFRFLLDRQGGVYADVPA